ncbi:TonB family protein [Zhongshania sp.]|uniref:TonB family protein n=1 Tax=Zhongshania sp. TaxID=1971902 RepID=UPI00356597C1
MNTVISGPLLSSQGLNGHSVLGADYWGIMFAADRHFKRILGHVISLLLVFLLALPFWVVEAPELTSVKPTVNYALELLPVPAPKPLAKPVVAKPQPKPTTVVQALKPEPLAPAPVVAPATKTVNMKQREQDAAAAAARRQAAAKAAAMQAGVMAFSQQLAQLRDNSDKVLVAEQNLRDRGAVSKESVDLSANQLSASKSSAGHGDIGQRSVSGQQASTGVGQHSTEQLLAIPSRSATTNSRGGELGNVKPSRSLEEIQLAFDRSKTAFYSIFNRAARKDTSIRAGTVVVSLTIQPDGSVSDCKIVSSSFFNPDLKEKLLQRVRMLKFEAKAVPAFTYPNYPISYMP